MSAPEKPAISAIVSPRSLDDFFVGFTPRETGHVVSEGDPQSEISKREWVGLGFRVVRVFTILRADFRVFGIQRLMGSLGPGLAIVGGSCRI